MKKDTPAARNAAYMKVQNKRLVLNLIRSEPVSRAEISRKTGLTRASITGIIDGLLSDGFIIETGTISGGVGRQPILLKLNPDAYVVAGINITRQSYHTGIVRFDGSVVETFSKEYDRNASPDSVIKHVTDGLKRLEPNKRLLGIGITTPGPVDSDRGIILNPPGFNTWHDYNIVSAVNAYNGAERIKLENNSIALTLAEKHYGVCRDISDYLLLLADQSGIGGGIVMNSKLYKGSNGMGGEIGHTTINFDGPQCLCGNKGCFEVYSGIPGMMTKGQWFGGFENNPEVVGKEAVYIASAVVNVLNLLDFQTIVMAGGASAVSLCKAVEALINNKKLIRNGKYVHVISSSDFGQGNILPAVNLIIDDFINGGVK